MPVAISLAHTSLSIWLGIRPVLWLETSSFRVFPFRSKVNYSIVTWATFTKSEVAHVGYTELWAKAEGLFVSSIQVNLNKKETQYA